MKIATKWRKKTFDLVALYSIQSFSRQSFSRNA